MPEPPTSTAFPVWEREQELRYGFDGVQAVGTTGATEHATISSNLDQALRCIVDVSEQSFCG